MPFGLLADLGPLRTERAFRSLWFGQVGSALAREASRLAVPLHVFLLTESAAAIALVALAQLGATVIFSIAGGALADLLDRRLLLLTTQVTMALASLGLVITALIPDPPLWAILACTVVVTALLPVEHPARVASIPRLVPPDRLSAAIAVTALNNQTAAVTGPAVAGILIAVWGVGGAYALMVAGYTWAAIASARMPSLQPLDRLPKSRIELIFGGFRFAVRKRVVMSTFALDLNAMTFGLPIALLPVLAIDVFGLSAGEVGLLAAARGVGALGAAVVSGWIPQVQRLGRAVLWVVLAFSAASLGLGLATASLPLAFALIVVCGATDVWSAVIRNSIVHATTPDALRGRITALHTLATQSGPRIGDIRASLTAEAVGVAPALAIGGAMAMAGVAAIARIFPELIAYPADSVVANDEEEMVQ